MLAPPEYAMPEATYLGFSATFSAPSKVAASTSMAVSPPLSQSPILHLIDQGGKMAFLLVPRRSPKLTVCDTDD